MKVLELQRGKLNEIGSLESDNLVRQPELAKCDDIDGFPRKQEIAAGADRRKSAATTGNSPAEVKN